MIKIAHQCNADQRSARAAQCTIENLSTDIPDYFVQIKPDAFALKGFSAHYIDLSTALPREGCGFRSTLVRDGDAWTILEWCEPVDSTEDASSFLIDSESQEVIVFASHVYISPEDAGLTVTQSFDDVVVPQPVVDALDEVDDPDPDELMINPQEHH